MLIFSTVLPAFDSKNMASVMSVVITSLFYQGVYGVPWFCKIGENIISEANSCQPSAGFMLRTGSQMAHTNPDIMERRCSSGRFVLTPLIFTSQWNSQLIMQTGAFSNVGDLVSVFCSCSYQWTTERSMPPDPEGSWSGLVWSRSRI